MRAGFAEIDFTPRVPCTMDGYAARTGPAEGVLDPIRTRVAVLDDTLALVVLDWCWVPRRFVRRLRRALPHIPHVLVAATHTHSGPAPSDDVIPKILRAVRRASRNATECEVRLGRAAVRGLGANRRSSRGPFDSHVRVLVFGKNAIVNYGCHPTTMGASNRKLSADFFGVAAGQRSGVTLMTNSACADVSTRFTRRSQRYSETRRFARILAHAVRLAVRNSRPVRAEPIEVESRTLRLQPRHPIPISRARRLMESAERRLRLAEARGVQNGELRRHVTRLEAARELLRRSRFGHRIPPCEIQTIRMGSLRLLAVPLELLTVTGRQLLRRHAMVFCYANGYSGYLVGDRAQDYESLVAAVDPKELKRFMNLVR